MHSKGKPSPPRKVLDVVVIGDAPITTTPHPRAPANTPAGRRRRADAFARLPAGDELRSQFQR